MASVSPPLIVRFYQLGDGSVSADALGGRFVAKIGNEQSELIACADAEGNECYLVLP
jgi:hypothetical protein